MVRDQKSHPSRLAPHNFLILLVHHQVGVRMKHSRGPCCRQCKCSDPRRRRPAHKPLCSLFHEMLHWCLSEGPSFRQLQDFQASRMIADMPDVNHVMQFGKLLSDRVVVFFGRGCAQIFAARMHCRRTPHRAVDRARILLCSAGCLRCTRPANGRHHPSLLLHDVLVNPRRYDNQTQQR